MIFAKRPLGEMLVEAGIISLRDLHHALESQPFMQVRLGSTVVRLGMASEQEVMSVLAHQLRRKIAAL